MLLLWLSERGNNQHLKIRFAFLFIHFFFFECHGKGHWGHLYVFTEHPLVGYVNVFVVGVT